MLTLRSAGALLADARSLDGLAAIARAIGLDAAPLALDAALRDGLGLAPLARGARLIEGRGTLRALLLEAEPGAPLRERAAAIARQLARRAPHLLWLVLAASPEAGESAVFAWEPLERGGIRIASLVARTDAVLPSDAETLRALAGGGAGDDLLAHAHWTETLGRRSLTRRFYRELEGAVTALAGAAQGRARDAERREMALLYLSRLLFLVFLEAKGWLDGDGAWLAHRYADAMRRGGRFHRRVLLPLFFGTLNTPVRRRAPAARALGRIPFLNGGLFARTPLERRVKLHFPDDALGGVIGGLLARYRFTAREGSADWSEAAIDPEMLGKAFESLMAPPARRASGSYYTPQPIVRRVTEAALREALAPDGADGEAALALLRGEHVAASARDRLRARLAALRVLDPACGSGAFLVHALETMADLARRLGDAGGTAAIRREILTHRIFGVDADPTAVWLCELRLWLSVVIESGETDPLAVPPLPNLDRNIRVGDALAGRARGDAVPARGGLRIGRLRERYVRATGARKRTLQRALDRAERALAVETAERAHARARASRRELLCALRGRDLFGERVRAARDDRAALETLRIEARALAAARRSLQAGGALPFAWATHFPDVIRDGGFEVVLGNPPWVRLHNIPATSRASLRAGYRVFRAAAWERGAAAARAGAGFAAQVDLAALFAERALDLLREHGTLALLLPAKLWRSLAGGGVRRLIAERARLVALEDWSASPHAFDAAVYPSLLVARAGAAAAADATVRVAAHSRAGVRQWPVALRRIGFDDDPASPWLTLPPPVREAFDRVARAGVALADSPLGPPTLGVKCGCNEAFTLTRDGTARALAAVRSGGKHGVVEAALLRPLVRGESVARWRAGAASEWMLWTHGPDGAPLPALPPHAAHWLGKWRRELAARSDARRGARWWALFRTASARADTARVVWADVAREPRALVLDAGNATVPLNTCYVLPCRDPRDAFALAALLNSPLAAAWLGAIAEPARGGWRRYLAWTVALLPLPRDWARARAILAPLAERACAGAAPADEALLAASLRAFRLRRTDVEPLLAWSAP